MGEPKLRTIAMLVLHKTMISTDEDRGKVAD